MAQRRHPIVKLTIRCNGTLRGLRSKLQLLVILALFPTAVPGQTDERFGANPNGLVKMTIRILCPSTFAGSAVHMFGTPCIRVGESSWRSSECPELVDAFRRGEREAIERVYRDHIDAVERFVRARLYRARRLSAANLADVVQEVFLKAFSQNARARYDGERDYAPFLMTVAANALIDWLRRTTREGTYDAAFSVLLESASAGSELGEGEMFAPELLRAVTSYLESLPPDLLAVYERRFVAAESQERTAMTLGISRQSLRTLEKKLIDGLRRQIRRTNLAVGQLVFSHEAPLRVSVVAAPVHPRVAGSSAALAGGPRRARSAGRTPNLQGR